jgi:hypothetical protein
MTLKVKLSTRKVITTTENSNDIKLIILLLIIYFGTTKNKLIPFKKLSYIFSLVIDDGESNKTKNLLETWDVEEIKPLLILGSNNALWNVEIKKGRISLSRSENTIAVYNEIEESNLFTALRLDIEKSSLITMAKLDRQKLML